MKHFFECMEREIDFPKEYEKLEEMISFEPIYFQYSRKSLTINEWIEMNFRNWRKRGNYTSFAELREQLGFRINNTNGILIKGALNSNITIEEYFLFCEMIINILWDFRGYQEYSAIKEKVRHINATIEANIEKMGLEIRATNDRYFIVEKNAVAIEVADKNPELADVIIEYNSYLLRGNLNRKRQILLDIADSLEPKQEVLEGIDKEKTKDFFFMVNNCNVRHNNSDKDGKFYKEAYTKLDDSKKEECYDLIYEQSLLLYMLLEQPTRNKRIDDLKKILKN